MFLNSQVRLGQMRVNEDLVPLQHGFSYSEDWFVFMRFFQTQPYLGGFGPANWTNFY